MMAGTTNNSNSPMPRSEIGEPRRKFIFRKLLPVPKRRSRMDCRMELRVQR